MSSSRAVRARLRARFDRAHFVRFPAVLDPDLLEIVSREIERSEFYERTHEGIGANKELCMRNRSTAGGLLHVLLNGDELFRMIEEITRSGPIGCFSGRVYRVVPGCGHRDAWHADVGEHRLVAMSINLSPTPFAGGILEIRDRRSGRIIRRVRNTGFGDAGLFRISTKLEHRITDVEGTAAKTAFAGWFQSEPTFRSMVAGARGAGGRV
ncbi:MAG: 2OG-Fe(II) oxygenase [Candidatus Binatia bacterium]